MGIELDQSSPPTVGLTVVFSFVDGKLLVVFDDLPLTDERSVLHTEINLVSQSTRGIEDGYDCGVDDLTAVHFDADFIADLRLACCHGRLLRGIDYMKFQLSDFLADKLVNLRVREMPQPNKFHMTKHSIGS
jgi:hypothetical protein